MKKNIQNSIDTNWKSYQAVAQANIHSLENLEIISYTRFNSSTRLYVGDDILVNNKLARIGTVFVDEVYGHRYSIAYPEMSLGHEEIVFDIGWVEDVSLLPGDNNLTGFRLEQVDTNELVIDMQGEMTSLTVTPYKTVVTPNNILDDIDTIFQSEFKGTGTIDIIEEGPSGTITEIETISSGESTFTEYQLVGTNVDGLISVNGVEQVIESEELNVPIINDVVAQLTGNESNGYIVTSPSTGGGTKSYQLFDKSSSWWSVGQQNKGNITIELPSIKCVNKYILTAYSIPAEAPKDFTLQGSNNNTDFIIIDSQTNQTDWSDGEKREFVTTNTTNYKFYKFDFTSNNGATYSAIAELELINESWNTITTYTSQTVDTNSLAITTDGTFDSLNYSTTISTPTEIVTDITKTITQDAQQENWTKYQLKAKNLDGIITVNGVEQVVESSEVVPAIINIPLTLNSHTGLTHVERINDYKYNFTGQFATVCYDIPDNIGIVTIRFSLSITGVGAYFGFGASPTTDIGNNHMPSNTRKIDGVGIHEYTVDCTNLTNKSFYFSDGSSTSTGSFEILSVTIPGECTLVTFTEQLVDTNVLELAVSGTVDRIDTKTYINEDIITTIQDTDSIIELEISDLPYTLTQEIDQTDFNNYLILGKGMTNQTVVTVNDLIQTVEYDIEGVSTLETTNDLYDIIRAFDYSVVVDEKTYDDITFTTPTTFTSLNTYETGKNLLLDNLNYSEVSSIEHVPQFRYENGDVDFDSTLTLTQDTGKNNWVKYQFSADDVNGDLIINELVQTVDRVEIYDIDFRYLFENGTSIEGGEINFDTDEIFGYRVSGTGPKGYYSVDMQHLYNLGLRELKFNVTSGTAGAVYIGRLVNGEVLDYANNANIFYGTSDIDYTLNLETKVLSYVVNGGLRAGYTAVPDLTNVALEHIVIGTSAIQASEYWQQWNVIPMSANKTYYTEIECDTNELMISGDASHLYYNTTEITHLLPTYTVEHKAYSKQTDIDGNVTHSFNTTEEYPYTDEVLPTTIREFEFPSLAVSYYDIDLETTIGPIDKQYDSINISEENITFDYNDETKANTNKISFEPENIKEIIIRSKKVQEDN